MIEVINLSKNFGRIQAVDDISFTVQKGEILGFLGPNGAGKSTSMRMITGFIPPSGGTAVVGGCDITKASLSAREKIGYLPENAPVYPEMTVFAYLRFCAEVRGFASAAATSKVDETLERCFLKKVRYQSIGTLSKGYRQRVCFAQSILHDPEYLIFDEPTDGLDPNQKHEVRQMIVEMSQRKAILLSTHILDEVEAVCTRIIIIAGGRLVADDTPANLKKSSSLHGAVSLTVLTTTPKALLARVRRIDGVQSAVLKTQTENSVEVRIFPFDPNTPIVDRIISHLRQEGFEVSTVFVEEGNLAEVFRRITLNDEAEKGTP
ncbi:MAG: ABC transporter ATP-binding protein [Desulfobacteraceae bacterium]|nr:ABC transporter ATP-binding protein [Desulfobacteraceae bacterium]MBU4001893.1 ABC transporter ATP-binding protein [Pseudomonadota bacterium]MBU4055136.1 ABC transporter ATP-binding protein [Pseudomonadota bacterium]